jgi:tetratricopeptide (TPR) repeat protein
MGRKLNLVDRLLAMGRTFQELGRDHDAQQILGRLSNLGELPAPVAEETQARLAEIDLKHHEYRRARRHLTAALAHQPGHARYLYLLAGALDNDERGDSRRAAHHYRKSLDLDPQQPRCLGEFGLLALRLGHTDEGLAALRRAVELSPNDPEAVGSLVEGLRQDGRVDEARAALRAARFRNPRDPRFIKLKNDFEFHQLRQRQARHGNAEAEADGPVLLPFVRPAAGDPAGPGRKTIRQDKPSPPSAPLYPRRDRRRDQKRAQ